MAIHLDVLTGGYEVVTVADAMFNGRSITKNGSDIVLGTDAPAYELARLMRLVIFMWSRMGS